MTAVGCLILRRRGRPCHCNGLLNPPAASETLSVRVPRRGIDVSIVGAIPADGSTRQVSELMILRELPDDIAALLAAAVPPVP